MLVLSRPDAYGDFVALAVTSRPQTERGIALLPSDLVEGHLPLSSWVRTDRVVTLNAAMVVKKFGRASEAAVMAALDRLCALLGHGPALPVTRDLR